MLSKKTFILTGFLGILLVGVSSCVLFVNNTFGSDIFALAEKSCIPYNVFVEKGSSDYSVKISWNTRKECLGFIQYGSTRDNLNLVAVDLENKAKSKTHEVTIEKLLTTQYYYFLINSDDKSYGSNGSALDFSLENL